MNNPTTSFIVVINGPVANAGSTLYLFKIRGMNVPNMAATRITVKRDILTTRPSSIPPKTVAIPKINKDNKIPFTTPTRVSFQILLKILPICCSPLANDWTTMAED